MPEDKLCFLNRERTCDLTCKAAFEVDDPVDNVDCHFIWLAYHFGEGLFEVKRVLQGGMFGGFGGDGDTGPMGHGAAPPTPGGPKGPSSN